MESILEDSKKTANNFREMQHVDKETETTSEYHKMATKRSQTNPETQNVHREPQNNFRVTQNVHRKDVILGFGGTFDPHFHNFLTKQFII